MKKPQTLRAWAVYGRGGGIYVTDVSPHTGCEGRFQVYANPFHAGKVAAHVDRIVEVEIRPIVRRKK